MHYLSNFAVNFCFGGQLDWMNFGFSGKQSVLLANKTDDDDEVTFSIFPRMLSTSRSSVSR
jgi:hypothetical protein